MVKTQAIASNLEAIAKRADGQGMTKKKLVESLVLGGRQKPIVGGPQTIAEELISWTDEADVDGFVLACTVTPECFEDFVDLVVPALQERGAYKTSYSPGTLREKLFAGQTALLPDRHPASMRRGW